MIISMKTPYRCKSPYAQELEAYLESRIPFLKESTLKCEKCYIEKLDQYLFARIEQKCPITSDLMTEWTVKKPWEKVLTQKRRFDTAKRIFSFLSASGVSAELPDIVFRNTQSDYIPYIYTREEIQCIFHAADQYTPTHISPYLHLTVPAAFRILYSCGLRSSELTGLKIRDMDLEMNAFCIWDTKFNKSRYVPFSPSLRIYLQSYIAQRYPGYSGEEYLISKSNGGQYHTQEVHYWHRKLLYSAGIVHAGKGKGPRVHDYRHTFAVHSLQNCTQKGQDIMAILPLLASYLGHKDLRGTQYYLHLTAELYPDIRNALGEKYGDLLEGGECDEA